MFKLLKTFILLCFVSSSLLAQDKTSEEFFTIDPEFEKYQLHSIAVLPMDNMSLEDGVDTILQQEVYKRLLERGYAKAHADSVSATMKELGITVPGLLSGISPARLGKMLGVDALMIGQIEQSASIHQGVYDAVVVSCSMRLVHAQTGKILWQTEQWRAAKRQFAIDPLNMLLNTIIQADSTREKRIAYLVQEMLKTLPQGAIQLQGDDLLNKATLLE